MEDSSTLRDVYFIPQDKKQMGGLPKTGLSKRLGVVLLSGASIAGLTAGAANADMMPPEKRLSSLSYELLGRDDLYVYKALDSYSEAPFLAEMVSAGTLPPVEERLPTEPVVHLVTRHGL